MNRLGFTPTGAFGDEESPTLARIADIPPMTARELACLVRDKLGCTAVRLNGKADAVVRKIGGCGGDGKDFRYPALSA